MIMIKAVDGLSSEACTTGADRDKKTLDMPWDCCVLSFELLSKTLLWKTTFDNKTGIALHACSVHVTHAFVCMIDKHLDNCKALNPNAELRRGMNDNKSEREATGEGQRNAASEEKKEQRQSCLCEGLQIHSESGFRNGKAAWL